MCVVFWTTSDPDYSLIIINNRDEFLTRPAAPATWRSESTTDKHASRAILSGLDVDAGGTWFGVTRNGAFATLTNFTEIPAPKATAAGQPLLSRGELVTQWLRGSADLSTFLKDASARGSNYAGFNLLLGYLDSEGAHIGYVTNRCNDASSGTVLSSGQSVNGLSNSTLCTPWPRVNEGKQRFAAALASPRKNELELVDRLFGVLSVSKGKLHERDEMRYTICVEALPIPSSKDGMHMLTNTDADHKRDTRKAWYGTRTSTVLLISRQQPRRATYVERDIYMMENERPILVDYTQAEARARHERRFEWTLS